jgi:hypothetical protein
MFSEFFGSPSRIQELREGQDGHLLEGFAQELCQAGYAKITALPSVPTSVRQVAPQQLL